jgi:hypothetical protein
MSSFDAIYMHKIDSEKMNNMFDTITIDIVRQGCPEVAKIGGGTIFWKFFENIYENLLEKL